MIVREGINAGLNIRNILLEQSKHVGIDTPLVWCGHARRNGRASTVAGALACLRGEPPEHNLMPGIPR